MADEILFNLELSREQWDAYTKRVELLLEQRGKNQALLSSFDLIAGASLLFFITGNSREMPAAWVFAGVREGYLPDGLLEKAQRLNQRLREIDVDFEELDRLAESVSDIQNQISEIRRQTKHLVDEMRAVTDQPDRYLFVPQKA